LSNHFYHTRVKRLHNPKILFLWLIFFVFMTSFCLGDDRYTAVLKTYPYGPGDPTVIGKPSWHTIQNRDTLLDIARMHGLGYNETALLYPRIDPWMPPVGARLFIPTFWVIPPSKLEQIVINIPELRLYFFQRDLGSVQTYPVCIGNRDWKTPLGIFYITEKRPNPTWYIPESLQTKYGADRMPPGPDNPMGEFAMKFSAGAYDIHGTHMPWGVGRMLSHGCIRCYPEHIQLLYPQVEIQTNVEIIYEPIKFGLKGGQIFVEVHPDVYGNIIDFNTFALQRLTEFRHNQYVDREQYDEAIRIKSGIPMNITLPHQEVPQELRGEPVVSAKTDPLKEVFEEPVQIETIERITRKDSSRFTLMVASMRNETYADQMLKRLREKDYTCRKKVVRLGDNEIWHRITVGNFKTQQEATHFSKQFYKDEGLLGIVLREDFLSEH
jgi:L,D-transpeptidase ErfK/SrfK